MGVWDTVGSLGLPHEIDPAHKDRHQLFSFPDCNLGEHIQSAYHALAVNEMRKDFVRSNFIYFLTCLNMAFIIGMHQIYSIRCGESKRTNSEAGELI